MAGTLEEAVFILVLQTLGAELKANIGMQLGRDNYVISNLVLPPGLTF